MEAGPGRTVDGHFASIRIHIHVNSLVDGLILDKRLDQSILLAQKD